jgi:riboflavin kinase/FMN adenylyltransferase
VQRGRKTQPDGSARISGGWPGMPISSASGSGAAVTIGFFDGVHLGHREVLERTVERARERSLRSVAVTFDRHPREILTPERVPRLLTTLERKISLIEQTGLEELVVLPFFVLIATYGAVWLLQHARRPVRVAGMLLLLAMPIQFAFFCQDYFNDYRLRSADISVLDER